VPKLASSVAMQVLDQISNHREEALASTDEPQLEPGSGSTRIDQRLNLLLDALSHGLIAMVGARVTCYSLLSS
jgi:hypothetical protein